jgi:hypothetical protein
LKILKNKKIKKKNKKKKKKIKKNKKKIGKKKLFFWGPEKREKRQK